MRVLGIDPGSRVTGFGVVDFSGNSLRYEASGCIKPSVAALSDRLKEIFEGVQEIITCHQPDVVAVEQVFMARNAQSALVLGHARGAVLCAAVQAGRSVAEYSALQIKQAVVGRGHAGKEQVQHMIVALLGLAATPPADAADALACAVCHINHYQGGVRLQRGIAGASGGHA